MELDGSFVAIVLFTLFCVQFIRCTRCHTKHIWLFQHTVFQCIIYRRELSKLLGVISHTRNCQFVIVYRIHFISVSVPCSIKIGTICLM